MQNKLIESFRNRAKAGPIDWTELRAGASEIVFFGSRALAVHERTSDLDVLVVGNVSHRIKRAGLDLICITTSELESADWLTSELAGHISHYGIWAEGCGAWRFRTLVGQSAVSRKERRILSLIENAKRAWAQLHPLFQAKYRTIIRRELQRLALLRETAPIPPTPLLDAEWRSQRVSKADLVGIIESIRQPPASQRPAKHPRNARCCAETRATVVALNDLLS